MFWKPALGAVYFDDRSGRGDMGDASFRCVLSVVLAPPGHSCDARAGAIYCFPQNNGIDDATVK